MLEPWYTGSVFKSVSICTDCDASQLKQVGTGFKSQGCTSSMSLLWGDGAINSIN